MPGKRKRNGGRARRKRAGYTYHYTTDDSGVVQKLQSVKRFAVEKVQRVRRTPKKIACRYCDSHFATTAARHDHVAINHPPDTRTPRQPRTRRGPAGQAQVGSPYADGRAWTECARCGARLLEKNLKRHLRRVH